jgi:uncharacterized protein
MQVLDFSPVNAIVGGLLTGLGLAMVYIFNGRIGGTQGVLSGILTNPTKDEVPWRVAWILGMVSAGLVNAIWIHPGPIFIAASVPLMFLAGVFMGFGSRTANGCTSGHGLIGVSRLSKRSIVATMTFMCTTILTVFVTRHLIGA